MAKKNTDGKSFNRTGRYNHEQGTVTAIVSGENVPFNLRAKLAEFDGEELSISATTDMNPTHLFNDDESEQE